MSNILKYKFILLLGISFLVLPACEDVTDLNVDPNNPTDVPAVNLVTEAEFQLNQQLWSLGINGGWSMLMVQQWSENEYAEASRYTVDGTDFNGNWADVYANVLNELHIAKEKISENPNILPGPKANQLAIVDILMAYAFHNLTDLWGDLPYSEALNSVEFPLPAYDSQQAIYSGILNTLDNAVATIDESEASFTSGELIYGGDMMMWKKLGNSLILRVAMRMVDVDQSTASSYIQQVAGGDLISSNADNALFVFNEDPNLANPLYVNNTLGNRDDYCVSDVLVDNLRAMGDPRLEVYAKPNNSGDIVGMPYGLTDGEAFALKSVSSRPSDKVRSATEPAVIMDYAEVQFLLAEAYERGIVGGDAAAAYAEGVTASMNYWGITDQKAIDDYIAANPYDAANWKESLGWQKWIAFYMNGPQAWAEWRRLDYPELEVPAAATNPVIPVRLPYPIDEQTRNGSSLNAVTDNPDDLSTKLWWDVN